jgi:hypothetical protein
MELIGMTVGSRQSKRDQQQFSLTKARRDGLYLILIGAMTFVLLSTALEYSSPMAMIDFKGPYYGSRCLLLHLDPYNSRNLMRVYTEDSQNRIAGAPPHNPQAIALGYLPSIFPITVPLAILRFSVSSVLWMALIVGSLLITSLLCWFVAAEYAPIVAGFLLGFMLANSELIAFIGNPSGIAISCCVAGAWCFLRDKYVPVGILCLALGLMIKPHDVCLVWLYFLLAGGIYRKRAMQTLVAAVGLSVPAVWWIADVAPNWFLELQSTLEAFSAHGGLNDPGPASSGAHRLGMMVNLQTWLSFVRDDPRFYNYLSYAVCGALLLIWTLATLRTRPSPDKAWLALAAISALTMLPIYHRQPDTKLLILSVPACAMLYAEGNRTGRAALLITAATFLFNGDLPWLIVLSVISHISIPNTLFFSWLVTGIQVFPASVSLLIMGTFYLWIYFRRAFRVTSPEGGKIEQGI